MKEANNRTNNRLSPYDNTIPGVKFFSKRTKIIENIRKLHSNAHINQKSNILSVIAYNSLKKLLRESGFKFSDSQFVNARTKRKQGNITLNNYKRYMPYSKRKIDDRIVAKICNYLEKYSRHSSREEGVKYLDKTKIEIYREYIRDGNEQLAYGTFLKICPREYKKGRKRTDVCGICELSKNILKKKVSGLNETEKIEYKRTKEIYEMHYKVVENQKNQLKYLKENLSATSCILILDFKENFKLSHGGNEISQDYYKKRQISCLGTCLIFKKDGQIQRHYLNYLSEILSHDSLFASDTLETTINSLKEQFKYFNIFTDCGPHFRSREFITRANTLSKKFDVNISVNFFGEHHGKSEVDGMFGKLSVVFKRIDFTHRLNDVNELKGAFEQEFYMRGWPNVFFTVYQRDSRPKLIKKVKFDGLKKVMSFLFSKGRCFYSFLTKIGEDYIEFKPKEENVVDKRETLLTPKTCFESRIKQFFNQRIHKMLKTRVG